MEFLDTPNPNAKKILIDHNFETSIYLDDNSSNTSLEVSILLKTSGIKNIFTGGLLLSALFLLQKFIDSDMWPKFIEGLKKTIRATIEITKAFFWLC